MNVIEDAVARVDRIGAEAGVLPEVVEALRQPEMTLMTALPVRMDDGTTRYFEGYRCHYNRTLGPTKGGIRYHPNVSVEEVQALALWMTIKCALAGLPFGGGKGGVIVDPKSLSPMELERLSRAYMRAMVDVVGPDQDIPAPDVYTNARIMGWMADEYQTIKRVRAPGVITGKPISLGGSLGRDEATGRGAYLVTELLADKLHWDRSDKRVAIQGFGNAGVQVARLLQERGYKIVAVSDSKGGIYSESGFDVESLYQTKQETRHLKGVYCEGSVCEVVEHDSITNEQLLELDVDLLIPAALEGVIHQGNVDRIKAPVIVEVANGPIAAAVDERLTDKMIVPDVLANAGGVIVSYFEWVQNRQGYPWSLDEVRTRLAEVIGRAFEATWAVHENEKHQLRSAAYVVAMRRLADAITAGGTTAYFKDGA